MPSARKSKGTGSSLTQLEHHLEDNLEISVEILNIDTNLIISFLKIYRTDIFT